MPITNESATIVFANCAGAAREETCNPKKLGRDLKKLLSKEELNGLVAVGLSEVIVSIQSLPRCAYPESTELPPYEPLDDLNDFQIGFDHKEPKPKKYYLSHVNSRNHCYEDAAKRKWRDSKAAGGKASVRIAHEFNLSRDVYQGTGALLFVACQSCEGLQLRRAGVEPLSVKPDDPLEYRGSRDSEPRSAIVIRELNVADDLTADLVFCQLETNSQDKRLGAREELEKSRGVEHRIAQIETLCSHLKLNEGRPVILLGDFNTRPGSKELDYLCEKYGFLQVLPKNVPPSPGANTWGESHAFGNPQIDRPNYEKREDEQGWPHSHLKHGILIDHAFVKGLDSRQWICDLKVIQLPEENEEERVSDHRPIALTIKRTR